MKININFQNQGLVRLEPNYENISFGINWQYQEIYYPDEHWSDIGIAVLGSWIGTIIELIEGEDEGQFPFFEGPYFLLGKYNRKNRILQIFPDELNIQCELKLADFIQELMIAINQVDQELKRRNIREKERLSLEKGIKLLKESLAKLESQNF